MSKVIGAVGTRNWRALAREVGQDLLCVAITAALVAVPVALQRMGAG